MEVVYRRVAGLDVHKKSVVACVRILSDTGGPQTSIRTFGTMTGDLRMLADWLSAQEVTHVVMESTGVYWKPVFNILESEFEVLLVNARHIKYVPGRKTDVSDAQWLQRLHTYGLLRGSFQPKGEIAVLRAYLRQRERLLDYAAAHIQHMQKALMQMNLHCITRSPTSPARPRSACSRHRQRPRSRRPGRTPYLRRRSSPR